MYEVFLQLSGIPVIKYLFMQISYTCKF